jgi:hypothetical protein
VVRVMAYRIRVTMRRSGEIAEDYTTNVPRETAEAALGLRLRRLLDLAESEDDEIVIRRLAEGER